MYPVSYTVSLSGDDINPLFVDIPTDQQLQSTLTNFGFDPCDFKPNTYCHIAALKDHVELTAGKEEELAERLAAAYSSGSFWFAYEDLDVSINSMDHKENEAG